MAMTQTLGSRYKPHGKTAYAIYRGQIGAESAFPHAVTQNAVFKTGDTLVTGAAADVFGYHSELERVMFVGEYNNDQEKYFKYMYDAQDRKSTRLNSSHVSSSYAVFCLKKRNTYYT